MHVRLPAAPGPARLTGMARFVRRPRAVGNCLDGDQTEGKKSKGEWWRQESRRCCLCLAELASLVKLVKDSDDEVRPRPCLVSRWDGAASSCCWLLSCCFLPTRFLLSGAAPFFLCCFGSDLSPPAFLRVWRAAPLLRGDGGAGVGGVSASRDSAAAGSETRDTAGSAACALGDAGIRGVDDPDELVCGCASTLPKI
jgi:hypothetical protein